MWKSTRIRQCTITSVGVWWSYSGSCAPEAKQCTHKTYLPLWEVLAKMKRNQFKVRKPFSRKFIKPYCFSAVLKNANLKACTLSFVGKLSNCAGKTIKTAS